MAMPVVTPTSPATSTATVPAAVPSGPIGERVHVSVRIRPLMAKSDGDDARLALEQDQLDLCQINILEERRHKSYVFDKVFSKGQEEVYEAIGRPMLEEAFKGFNVCLFAYGQTGSGKTYTIQGDEANPGILPRFVSDMFLQAQQKVDEEPGLNIRLSFSYIEIYMEKIRDLLQPRVKGKEPETLELHEDEKKRVFIKDVGVHSVLSVERVLELLEFGNSNRQTAETKMNEFSSRSHSVVQFTLLQQHESLHKRDIESTVFIVDLAGSERQGKAMTTGLQFEEAKKINHSLLSLGRALNSFSDGKHDFISLRESKLTRLLSESFGGNSKTWMLATISPSLFNIIESLSTLDYATNAKKITNMAEVNKLARHMELVELRKLVNELQAKKDRCGESLEELQRKVAYLREEKREISAAIAELEQEPDTVAELLEAKQKENLKLRREIALLKDSRPEALVARAASNTFVGRAALTLESVFLGVRKAFALTLKDTRGNLTSTSLHVMLTPLDASLQIAELNRKSPFDAEGTLVAFSVTILRATGVPEAFSHRVCCKYSLRHDEESRWFRTPEVADCTNPVWNFATRFTLAEVTREVIEMFCHDCVVFELFADKV